MSALIDHAQHSNEYWWGWKAAKHAHVFAPSSASLLWVSTTRLTDGLVTTLSELGSMIYLLHTKYTFFYRIENGSARESSTFAYKKSKIREKWRKQEEWWWNRTRKSNTSKAGETESSSGPSLEVWRWYQKTLQNLIFYDSVMFQSLVNFKQRAWVVKGRFRQEGVASRGQNQGIGRQIFQFCWEASLISHLPFPCANFFLCKSESAKHQARWSLS